MRIRNPRNLIALFFLLFTASISFAQKGYINDVIESSYSNGDISYEEALLQKFYAGFDKEKLNVTFKVANQMPGKCATTLVKEYVENKSRLSDNAVQIIESYIGETSRNKVNSSTYISPYGKFELTYSISGSDAVSATDADGNGTPDYVEKIASYFDYSWKFLIDTLGYEAPPIGNGYYQISFEDMEYYGYTTPTSARGMTYIVMHNNYIGFGNNDDPEDPVLGAAKVTAIHEFKHALQYTNSDWKEPGWIMEVDATWTEDIGYDYVNDYYNYLRGSQITDPSGSFEKGDGYEDCIWMHYLSQKHGVQINREIWERSKANNESIYQVFDNVLKTYNSTYEDALMEYFTWNLFCGNMADEKVPSYEEAKDYPSPGLCGSFSLNGEIPNDGCGMDEMGANFIGIKSEYDAKFFKLQITPGNAMLGTTIVVFPTDGAPYKVTNKFEETLEFVSDEFLSGIEKIYLVPVALTVSGSKAAYSYVASPYSTVQLTHTPLKDTEDNSRVKIDINVINESNLAVFDSLFLYYRINSGDLSKVSLTDKGNNLFEYELTGVEMESKIDYYFSIEDSLKNKYYLPLSAPSEAYSFFVGADKTPPAVEFADQFNSKSIYNFPLELSGKISDNIGISEAYIEYNLNEGTSKKIDITLNENGMANALLNIDTTGLEIPAKLSYKVVVKDNSTLKNRTTVPQEGYYEINLAKAKYYSSLPNLHIPDNNFPSKRDTIIIEEDITISDIDVVFKAKHARFSDMNVQIRPPVGLKKELFNRPGLETIYSKAGNPNLIFDDEALTEMGEGYYLANKDSAKGYFLPTDLDLASLEGQSAKGTWIIYLYDKEKGYEGDLTEWGLIIQGELVSDVNEPELTPTVYALEQNYPNPFNPTTVISYQLPKSGNVSLKVYDVLGKEVATLVNEVKQSGSYHINFDASNLASGVYIYTIRANDYVSSKKMLLIK